MTEPSRKKRKGRHQPQFMVAASKAEEPSLMLRVTGDSIPKKVSFQEFADGSIRGHGRWNGDFSGRPELIRALFGHVKTQFAPGTYSSARGIVTSFRAWWRLFDRCEQLAPVTKLEDIHDGHAAIARRDGVSSDAYSKFGSLVNRARQAIGLPTLYWMPIGPGQPSLAELPEPNHVKAIYTTVKHRVHQIWQRWEEADSFAEQGRDWSKDMNLRAYNQIWPIEDIYATFCGSIAALNHPCPAQVTLQSHLGRGEAFIGQRVVSFTTVQAGLYPSLRDIRDLLLLFMIRTGWNQSTALNIDVSTDNWIEINPLSPMFHVVKAIKDRGNTIQVAIGLEKSQVSPGNIIRALIKRTAPLRAHLARDVNAARDELGTLLDPSNVNSSQSKVEELETKIARLKAQIASPWLYAKAGTIGFLSGDALSGKYRLMDGTIVTYMRAVISEANSQHRLNAPIPDTITPGDFRDAYIAFAYRTSGYNWLVAMLAAGHKSIESLKAYLRQRQWRAHSSKKIVHFGNSLWQEIIVHKRVEPAILFAMVQHGEVTQAQCDRWLNQKDRTRQGVGCRDFKNPPRKIAPNHAKASGCRVQRCVLCEHAVVFDDSLDGIARRLAELIHTKSAIPLATWHASEFERELRAAEETLLLYPAPDVTAAIGKWQEEIGSGRHVPFMFEGAYG